MYHPVAVLPDHLLVHLPALVALVQVLVLAEPLQAELLAHLDLLLELVALLAASMPVVLLGLLLVVLVVLVVDFDRPLIIHPLPFFCLHYKILSYLP
jgi:hypothetical protein